MLISALVTTIGSNTVLAHPPSSSIDASASDSPDVVTVEGSALLDDMQQWMFSTGHTLYVSCRSVTTTTARGGKVIAHGSTAAVGSTVESVAFAAHGVGSGIMFTIHLPGKIVGPMFNGHAVSDLIQPASGKPVPVISAETSANALARLTAAQQQEIASLQAAQLAANQALDGAVIAGDPNHGGYPAKWDDIPQDSTLDSWGMYNRECVSYAAWKVYQTYGSMPYWGGVGNANQWPGDARRAGIPTGSVPQVNSVAISMRGYYGHAMWVQKVSGTMVYVSQYNYDLHGHYSEMWVDGSDFTYIYFK
ncbi:MAG TPA: CHAP domain-containing protein [Verrucomicrobiae bacterium]|nr:CHAP domain-containing protein [Verrucomicrobiae bacterium]